MAQKIYLATRCGAVSSPKPESLSHIPYSTNLRILIKISINIATFTDSAISKSKF